MDPVTLLLIFTIASGIATAGAGIVGRAKEREEERNKVEYEKAKLEQQKTEALGKLDYQLQLSKEADIKQAGQIQRSSISQFGSNMQQTYIEQMAAESQLLDTQGEAQQTLGQLALSQGISGAKQDTLSSDVLASQANQQIATQKNLIGKKQSFAAGQGAMNILEARRQANELVGQYNEGSTLMKYYNYQKEQINAGATIESNWLDKVKQEYTYNGWWFAADFFGTVGAATDTFSKLYGYGLIK